MLISPKLLSRLGVQPNAVMHVGAHRAEERPAYRCLGWRAIAWVEALPSAAAHVRVLTKDAPLERVYEGAAYSRAGLEIELMVASNGESSSILPFQDHTLLYPEITETGRITVKTLRLSDVHDDFARETGLRCELINLDIQGAEREALVGLGSTIRDYTWVYCEVSTRALYRGQPVLSDMDSYLAGLGFRRVLSAVLRPEGWGDALYISWEKTTRSRWLAWRLAGIAFLFAWQGKQLRRYIADALRRR